MVQLSEKKGNASSASRTPACDLTRTPAAPSSYFILETQRPSAAASEEVCIRSNFAHAAADGAGLVGAVPPLVAGAVQQLVAKSACGLCRGQWAN
eukprot:CAMPEP_0196703906 /NCGR_PEP_ID=MMETSP1090-20130531/56843_1 /TAXON_ID=37098 /ORGANISM="Isochrysis sp, Strain CCMP1244" /LENGTH=94 /DNA_ID=CAMNT_0042043781 /DNA_START=211 /DNA_END=493 /DNA_ORIENTATION=-